MGKVNERETLTLTQFKFHDNIIFRNKNNQINHESRIQKIQR